MMGRMRDKLMMISERYSVKLTNEFEKTITKDSRFVLFGASSRGIACYEYLKEKGISDQVVCFVDSDAGKHGNRKTAKLL